MKSTVLFAFIVALVASASEANELRLDDVLKMAEKNDERISATEMGRTAAESAIGVARSGYYPRVDFEAIDSTGFPGSTGALGIGGVMGSSYRKGWGAGLVAQASVWDFGRTSHSVAAAEHEAHARDEEVRLSRLDVDLEAARLYFACVRNRSRSENFDFVLKEARLVADEVGKFVRTGQRSIVERYLAQSQVVEALTAQADATERMRLTLDRIGILAGIDPSRATCPAVESVDEAAKLLEPARLESPYLAAATERAQAEAERAKQARAGHLPRLIVTGSYGALDESRLVPKGDYALGVGLVLPLFDGLRTTSEVRQAEALATQRSFLIEAERDRIAQTNARYDEVIEGAKAKLKHLEPELKLAREGFDVAKRRYFKLQGVLVDVREALRNLSRMENEVDETRLDLVEGLVAKAIFNGGRPSNH